MHPMKPGAGKKVNLEAVKAAIARVGEMAEDEELSALMGTGKPEEGEQAMEMECAECKAGTCDDPEHMDDTSLEEMSKELS
jgi:hypothetical protein